MELVLDTELVILNPEHVIATLNIQVIIVTLRLVIVLGLVLAMTLENVNVQVIMMEKSVKSVKMDGMEVIVLLKSVQIAQVMVPVALMESVLVKLIDGQVIIVNYVVVFGQELLSVKVVDVKMVESVMKMVAVLV
jgi:hypothetical protein